MFVQPYPGGVKSRSNSLLDRLAAFSWKYLLILAAVSITFYAMQTVKVVVIPVLLAFFLTSVLSPPVQWLKRKGWSPIPATWGGVAVLLIVLALVGVLLVPSFASGLGPLGEDLEAATESTIEWLSEGPLQLSDTQIEEYLDTAVSSLQENLGNIATGVLGGATVAFEILTGAVLTFLAAFFYLKDGDRGFRALLERVPNPQKTERALVAAWTTLSSYVRGLATVGLVDAVLIGVGLAILGTPLALPLAVLVFLGGFFPIVGAFVSGLVAVAVAFVNGGPTDALIVLAIVVGVQQLEGNVLYPIIFKRALELHPLIILLAIAVGGVAFGIVGAFLAVPLTAMAVAVAQATADDPDHNLVSLLQTKPYQVTAVDRPQAVPSAEAESDSQSDPDEA